RVRSVTERWDVVDRRRGDVLQPGEGRDRLVDGGPGAPDLDVAVAHGAVDAGGLLDLLEVAVVGPEELGELLTSVERYGSLHLAPFEQCVQHLGPQAGDGRG